jgi:phosphatidylglycerol:prolipoprotein diacylglycerol transferase
MHPDFAGVPAYRVTFAAGIVVAAVVGAYGLHRSGLSVRECVRTQVLLVLAGLVGAKLFSIYERGGYFSSFAGEITEGYRYPGGILGVAVALALWVWRRRLVESRFRSPVSPAPGVSAWRTLAVMADALAPSVGIGAAMVRLGCFFSGCCFGVRSELPWSVRFPPHSPPWEAHLHAGWIGPGWPESLPVHPLQLYFILLSLAAAALAFWFQRRKRFNGQAALVFVMVDQLGKAGLEALRHEAVPGLQAASLVIGVTAAVVLMISATKARISGVSQRRSVPRAMGNVSLAVSVEARIQGELRTPKSHLR